MSAKIEKTTAQSEFENWSLKEDRIAEIVMELSSPRPIRAQIQRCVWICSALVAEERGAKRDYLLVSALGLAQALSASPQSHDFEVGIGNVFSGLEAAYPNFVNDLYDELDR